MKATYSKPVFEVVVFELNEAVASCQEKIHNNHSENCEETELGALLINVWGANFTIDKTDCTKPVDGYCYYTSENAHGPILFDS